MMEWYKRKKVFITGGSSGIGKATAKKLATLGSSVCIAARDNNRLMQALDEIKGVAAAEDQVFEAIQLDVRNKLAVEEAAQKVIAKLGGLDILINNAGISHPGYVQEIPDHVFDAMMQVNYFGTVHVTRAFLRHFVGQKSGHIANVSSLLGFMGVFGYTAYAASKFAVAGFSDALRQELLPHNIGVSVLFPADTDTPQLHEEDKIKPPETKAIAGNVKVMSAESVAEKLLSGIAKGKYHIVPGFGSKFTYFMYRHAPWIVRSFIDADLKKYQKRKAR
ncbi:MAG: SDR family oxidoreductase [Pseudomonadota bacterium]